MLPSSSNPANVKLEKVNVLLSLSVAVIDPAPVPAVLFSFNPPIDWSLNVGEALSLTLIVIGIWVIESISPYP